MSRFCDVIDRMIEGNIPFFLYRLPNSMIIKCGYLLSETIRFGSVDEFIGQKGFVMAPFEGDKCYFLPADRAFELPHELDSLDRETSHLHFSEKAEPEFAGTITSKEEYVVQCSHFINEIRQGNSEKVILSRIVQSNSINKRTAPALFESLCDHYTSAYVFLVNMPGVTTWIGATPETLLSVHRDHFTTMSLAGTQKWDDQITSNPDNWSPKDREEQAIVTRYICKQVESLSLSEVTCSSLQVKRAGNVAHLQTLIQGKIRKNQIAPLIKALHPTPAVCGSPKEEACKLIKEVETHSRSFYAGYLGYTSEGGDLELFVNLRSARLLKDYGLLYVGGGITAESKPALEWEETCLKARTILNVLI